METEKVRNTVSKIKIIKFENSIAVIFPDTYSKNIFIHPDKVSGVFTPSESTIRYIEENLSANFDVLITERQKPYFGTKIFKKDLQKYDKQYFGFINKNKDSIVSGIIINFESDPFKVKSKLEKDALFCNDGWCDSNRLEFYFNINSRKFLNMEQ